MSISYWYRYGKYRSLRMIIRYSNLALMHGNILFYDMQSDTTTDILCVVWLLIKTIENTMFILIFNTDARISYLQYHVLPLPTYSHRNTASYRVVFESIRKHIHHHPAHLTLVEIHLDAGWIDFQIHHHPPTLCVILETFDNLTQELDEVTMRQMQFLIACIKLSHIEQLCYLVHQHARIAPHQIQLYPYRFLQLACQ